MNYSEFLETKKKLENMIERECTGTAEELAQRLGFSRRTVFNYLDILKNEGYEIKFNRCLNTYYFDCVPREKQ